MTIDKAKLTGLMRQCQRGVPGTGRAIEAANNLLALCYSSIEPLIAEIKSTESRLHDVAVLCAQVEQDRDQLKAENEALTEKYEAARDRKNSITALQIENEALRKDAERWRFVRDPIGSGSPFAVWSERTNLFLGRNADEAIDAAMGKEVQP